MRTALKKPPDKSWLGSSQTIDQQIPWMGSRIPWMGSSLSQKWEGEEKPTEKGQGSKRLPRNPAGHCAPGWEEAGRHFGVGLEWPESDKSILTITLRGQEFNGNRALEVAQRDNWECVELAAPSCLGKAKPLPPSPGRSLHPLGGSSSQFSSSQSHS